MSNTCYAAYLCCRLHHDVPNRNHARRAKRGGTNGRNTYAMPRDHPLVSIYSQLLQQPILAIVKGARWCTLGSTDMAGRRKR